MGRKLFNLFNVSFSIVAFNWINNNIPANFKTKLHLQSAKTLNDLLVLKRNIICRQFCTATDDDCRDGRFNAIKEMRCILFFQIRHDPFAKLKIHNAIHSVSFK